MPAGDASASAAPGPTAVAQPGSEPSRPQSGDWWKPRLAAMICAMPGTLAPAPSWTTAGSLGQGRGPWARAAALSVSQPSAGHDNGCWA